MSSKARVWLIALVAALLAPQRVLGATAVGASDQAASLLARAVQTQATAAYRGQQILASWQESGTQVTIGRVEHDPRGLTRLDFTPMESSKRLVVLRHSDREIQYDPVSLTGTRRTRLERDDGASLTDHLPWLLANYRITAAPSVVLGRYADRFLIAPTVADRPALQIDVDRQMGVVLRSERFDPGGRLLQLTAFLTFEPMPPGWRTDATLPPDLRLTDQPGVQRVVLQEARSRLGAAPVEVVPPPGFHPIASYLTQDKDLALQTIYSDGLSILVITQQRGILARPPAGSRQEARGGGPAWVRQAGSRTLVHWAYAGWLITMVGDLTPASLLQAAERTGVAREPRLLDHLEGWLKSLRALF